MNEAEIVRRTLTQLGVNDDNAPSLSLSFTAFKQRVWGKYSHTPFHELIDRELQQIITFLVSDGRQGHDRLIVSMPPRHGKSESISKYFPAYALGMMPDLRLIATSHTATLAWRNSRGVRSAIQTNQYRQIFPVVELSKERSAVDEWYLQHHDGGMRSAGVGGGLTGFGGRLVIIDDPIKSRHEAESLTYRDRLKAWYESDLYSRLEEPGAMIIVMTRWHHDDLVGWLLGENLDGWRYLSLPALAEVDDPLGREIGEALWPERYGKAVLEKRRLNMGPYAFESEYQQNPSQSKDALFDTGKIKILDAVPEVVESVRFYDLAVTARSRSSYTVGLKLGITSEELLVVMDVWRVQRELPDVQMGIIQNAMIDGPSVRIRLEAEKGGIVELQYLMREPSMRPFTIDSDPPQGDKYTRAGPVASRVNAGRLALVRGSWNRAFLNELSLFPSGPDDDQVDALSGAFKMLIQGTAKLAMTANPFFK